MESKSGTEAEGACGTLLTLCVENSAQMHETTSTAYSQARSQVAQVIDSPGVLWRAGRASNVSATRADGEEGKTWAGRIKDAVGHVPQKLDAFAPSTRSAQRW